MWEDKAKVYTLLKDEHLKELYDFLLINNLDFEQFLINNNLKLQLDDIKKKYKKIDNLAKACANAQSDDFKALWYHKLIDLAREYKMLDYVMRKVIH